MRQIIVPHYQFCNGGDERPPCTDEDQWTLYWFDGDAKWEDVREVRPNYTVHGNMGFDVVQGLVAIFMFNDLLVRQRYPALVITSNPEHIPYRLENCKGRFWGPVYAPPMPPRHAWEHNNDA